MTTAPEMGKALADILAELYEAEVAVKDTTDYAPWIDEYYFDGLIVLAADYYRPPKTGFVDDVQRTGKPVLWLGYHGWLLGQTFLASRGLAIRDHHRGPMTSVVSSSPIPLTPRDATVVEAPGDSVLYWLTDAQGDRTPGALHAGNFTYVAYVPNVDLYTAEFAPLLTAIRSAFGTGRPPRHPRLPSYSARIAMARRDGFRTGIHLPVYAARTTERMLGYDADQWHANLIRIKASGAEWVNLVRTYQMADLEASTIEVDPVLTPTLDSLADIVADAHKLGLLVRLHVAVNLLQQGAGEWHGMIRPSDRPAWWASYDARLVEIADFARTHEVESLMLGTEFTSMQGDADKWRWLIGRIRTDARFPGLIGYGVNYDSRDIEWFDALDFVSVSAYWPLSRTRDPDLPTLMRSWSVIGAALHQWTQTHLGVPLEFGEIGYVSQPYASVLPFSWKAHRGRQQSLVEQLRCYESVREFLAAAPYISGIHFFASTVEDTQPASIGYTPFGKPAERVMKAIIRMR